MALIDRKISNWSQAVSSLDDKPKMTATALKAAFDSNSNQLKPAINGIIDDLTGTNGASNIGLTTIDGIDGENVQAILQSLADNDFEFDKLFTDKGAGLVGVSPIDGIDGENVQAILQSLVNNDFKLDKLFTNEGAGLVGVSPIDGIDGENVQAMLKNLYTQMMEIDTGDPNPAQYIKKTEKGQPNGVATLDENGDIEQLPDNVLTHVSNKSNPHSVTASQVGAYTKSQCIASSTATSLGLSSSATPNDAFIKIKSLINTTETKIPKIQALSYVGTGTYQFTLNFPFAPKLVLFMSEYEFWNASNGEHANTFIAAIPEEQDDPRETINGCAHQSNCIMCDYDGLRKETYAHQWKSDTQLAISSYNNVEYFNEEGYIYTYLIFG